MGQQLEFWIFLVLFVVLPVLQWIGRKFTEAKQSSPEDQQDKRKTARELFREAKQEAAQRDATRSETFDPARDDHDRDLVEDWEDDRWDPNLDDQEVLARAEQDARRDTRRDQPFPSTDPTQSDPRGPMRDIANSYPTSSKLKRTNPRKPPADPPHRRTRPKRKPIEMDPISTHAYDIETNAYAQKKEHRLSRSVRQKRRADLKRYFIWKEILSPPVALREPDENS